MFRDCLVHAKGVIDFWALSGITFTKGIIDKQQSVGGYHTETGIIFPDQFSPATVSRSGYVNGKLQKIPLSAPEAKDLINGTDMIYVMGRITYTDGFKYSHWTQFCKALTDAPANHRCVQYNTVDKNQ